MFFATDYTDLNGFIFEKYRNEFRLRIINDYRKLLFTVVNV